MRRPLRTTAGPAEVSATYGERVVGRASWHRVAGPRAEVDIAVEAEFARGPLAAHLLVRLARLADATLLPTLVVRAGPAVTAGFAGGTEIRTQDWPEALAALEHTPARGAAPGTVVIAGGGVAGLECMMALRDLEGDDLRIVLVSASDEFAYRPLAVAEPFSLGRVRRYPLAPIAADFAAELVQDSVVEVQPGERRAVCASGATLDYGALGLAPGARPEAPLPHALTFGAPGSRAQLEALLDDLRAASCRDVAFLVPPETSWSLPLYELALMTAGEAPEGTRVWLVTPERRPLAVFGPAVSGDVARVLEAAGVQFVGSARGVPEPGASGSTAAWSRPTPWWRCQRYAARRCAGCRPTSGASSPRTSTAVCGTSTACTPPGTRRRSRSSRAAWPLSRRTPWPRPWRPPSAPR
jgi:hypothetical protein